MSRSKSRPDIDTLLADRARFEAWLDQLLAKAAQMPQHVVERVRGDYEQRLAVVVEDLRSRADDLHSEARSLDERLADLDGELGAKRDARAEDEIRALVGEFEESVWQSKAAEHDEIIGGLDSERSARMADLARIRDLLDQATRPSRAMRAINAEDIPEEPTPIDSRAIAAPEKKDEPAQAALDFVSIDPAATIVEEVVAEPEPEQEPEREPERELAAEPEPEATAASEPEPPPIAPQPADNPAGRRPSPFDEIGFLRTVVGRATPYAGVELTASGPRVTGPSAAVVAPAAPVAPDLMPPPRVSVPISPIDAPPPPPPIASAQPAAAAPRSSIPNFQPPPIPDLPAPAIGRGQSQAMPMFGDPVVPDVSSGAPELDISSRLSKGVVEVARSLKCQECGWMNYPTEWYCEKCGGELAAF